jgi:hypothetical protein
MDDLEAARRKERKKQLPPGALLIGTGVALAAALFLMFMNRSHSAGTGIPCSCPLTETVVSSLDWFGDGQSADEVFSWATKEFLTPTVALEFNSYESRSEADTALSLLTDNLTTAGLIEGEQRDGRPPTFSVEGARVRVWTDETGPFRDPPPDGDPYRENDRGPLIVIEVHLSSPSDQALSDLTPLVAALGIID